MISWSCILGSIGIVLGIIIVAYLIGIFATGGFYKQ